ncbi:hypothetical protein KIH07_17525 [Hydrogenophaga taeniospiralis]|jgi:hypothetical protein|uniref:hypothetical protein n=1 Tax=Hydrogenophaga taeniospiralis TaxID=65656 RepID=UPI001CFB57C9|nr:hypothetical protein [Hydrogenophaga taeniospiralis]MCB4365542.1 hypothetical protein [Hydrogenophaga taeniospiralis]
MNSAPIAEPAAPASAVLQQSRSEKGHCPHLKPFPQGRKLVVMQVREPRHEVKEPQSLFHVEPH